MKEDKNEKISLRYYVEALNKGYAKGSKDTAKELINEFSLILMSLKAGQVFTNKLDTSAISQGGYLFVLKELERLKTKYNYEKE